MNRTYFLKRPGLLGLFAPLLPKVLSPKMKQFWRAKAQRLFKHEYRSAMKRDAWLFRDRWTEEEQRILEKRACTSMDAVRQG